MSIASKYMNLAGHTATFTIGEHKASVKASDPMFLALSTKANELARADFGLLRVAKDMQDDAQQIITAINDDYRLNRYMGTSSTYSDLILHTAQREQAADDFVMLIKVANAN